MVKLNFLPNACSDVNHIWQLRSFDDRLASLCVLLQVVILFDCHGKIVKHKQGKKPILLYKQVELLLSGLVKR